MENSISVKEIGAIKDEFYLTENNGYTLSFKVTDFEGKEVNLDDLGLKCTSVMYLDEGEIDSQDVPSQDGKLQLNIKADTLTDQSETELRLFFYDKSDNQPSLIKNFKIKPNYANKSVIVWDYAIEMNKVDKFTEEFYNTIKGAKGENGKSAYELAVANGFKGSESEWVASLKGKDGISVIYDNSITTPKIADRAVTPSKASFFTNTKNLFDGTYHRIFVSGAVGTTNAYLYNNDANRRTAIVPVVAGKTYYVKSHDPSITDNFRIGLNQTIPTSYDSVQFNTKIASITTYNDTLKESSFTSDITGFAFITVSKSGQEPRLQVEEGTVATGYTSNIILDEKYIQGHRHVAADITDFGTEMAKKSDMTHKHVIGDVTGLQSVLDGKALISHTHTIANVTNLQAELDKKVGKNHTHAWVDIADNIVTPDRTSFMTKTKNLFDGKYYPYFVSGVVGGKVYLYNTDPLRRTAIVPVKNGVTYYVKSHDPTNTDNFRLALHTTVPTTFDANSGTSSLTSFLIYNDQLKESSFTSTLDGYAFITLSKSSKEPLLQVEEGTNPTPYVTPYTLNESYIPPSIKASVDKAVTDSAANNKLVNNLIVDSEKNLFDGKYINYFVSGSEGGVGYLYNTDTNRRTAVAPIEKGRTYAIKSHDPLLTNNFRVAVHTKKPTDIPSGASVPLTKFLIYSDNLKHYTFTSEIDGFVFVTVSSTGQEPRLQIEKGSTYSKFAGYQAINETYIQQSIEKMDIEPMPLFPKVANMQMIPTEPGARFVEYFDGKMWGYTAGSGNISYSTDEGKTWVVYARGWNHTEWGWINRLMKTADGEVIAMTGTDLRKSSGWSTGNPTWSENKITKHAGADLFQFSLDGDGTKFIVCEYSGSSSRWSDSRFVWISTDKGDTWKVVYDALEKLGEEKNAETHLHGVAYDRWDDRFYFTQGHGRNGGLYVSKDNGATWLQPNGYRDGVLSSLGIAGHQYPGEDTNGATVLVATPTGLVMGSDNAENGMFGLVKKDDIMDEVVTITYAAKDYKAGLNMFAIRGFYDDMSDTVIVTFRAEFDNVPPIICAGTPTKATMIYEYPNLPVRGGQDLFGAVAKTSPDRLVAYAQFGGVPYTVHADLVYPASEIKNIIYQELKKYKLI